MQTCLSGEKLNPLLTLGHKRMRLATQANVRITHSNDSSFLYETKNVFVPEMTRCLTALWLRL